MVADGLLQRHRIAELTLAKNNDTGDAINQTEIFYRILEELIMLELTNRKNNRQVATYNPFREMEEMERNFFADPFGAFFGRQDLAEFKTDVTDEGDHYLMEADLPGFDKKDIHLDINGDTLIVHAERHSKAEEKDQQNRVVRVERSYGSYSRSFDISAINADGIKAKYENGVLTLTLPKKEATTPETKRLEIE